MFILRFFKGLFITLLVLYALLWLVPHVMPLKHDVLNEKPYSNSQFTRIDEVKVHYRYWSSQASTALGNVMLLHGFGGSTYSWRNNILALTDAGYNVLVVDLPAFGYSDKSKGINHSNTARSALLWTLADRVGLQYNMEPYAKWHLAGHSMSGEVVAAMSALQPERAKSVIFVDGGASDTQAKKTPMGKKILRALLPARRTAEVVGGYYLYKPKRIKKMLRKAYGQEPDTFAVNAYMLPLRQPRASSAIVEAMVYSEEVSSYKLEDIKQPALIIWGTEDESIPFSEGEKLDEVLYDSQIQEIQGAAHNPMETHPGEFNRILIGFLDGAKQKTAPTRQIIGQ